MPKPAHTWQRGPPGPKAHQSRRTRRNFVTADDAASTKRPVGNDADRAMPWPRSLPGPLGRKLGLRRSYLNLTQKRSILTRNASIILSRCRNPGRAPAHPGGAAAARCASTLPSGTRQAAWGFPVEPSAAAAGHGPNWAAEGDSTWPRGSLRSEPGEPPSSRPPEPASERSRPARWRPSRTGTLCQPDCHSVRLWLRGQRFGSANQRHRFAGHRDRDAERTHTRAPPRRGVAGSSRERRPLLGRHVPRQAVREEPLPALRAGQAKAVCRRNGE